MHLDNGVFVYDDNDQKIFTGDMMNFKRNGLISISKTWFNSIYCHDRTKNVNLYGNQQDPISKLMQHLKEQVRMIALFPL